MPSEYRPTATDTLVRWAYSLLLTLVVPFALVKLVINAASSAGVDRGRRWERFGLIPAPPQTGGLLIHCVSVGEVVAASKLIDRWLAQNPDDIVTITTTTATGSERVQQLYGDRVHHFYLPFDLPLAMSGMLKKVKPRKLLITEVELWPNLIDACWKNHIPVYIINARMTDKSCRNYQKVRRLFSPMLEKVHAVFAQGQRDFDNYLALGLPKQHLHLTNNIKFDLVADLSGARKAELTARYNPARKAVFIAGSTHDPEEKQVVEAFQQLIKSHPNCVLLLVPRHPQRFDKVWQLCQQSGLDLARSSAGGTPDTQLLLVDEMGVLSDLYGLADMAFVGGSLADKGGHNALEAAVHGVPVLMGPNTYNNPEICQVLKDAGALTIVQTAAELAIQLTRWMDNTSEAKVSGLAGQSVVKENAGAIQRTLFLIEESEK